VIAYRDASFDAAHVRGFPTWGFKADGAAPIRKRASMNSNRKRKVVTAVCAALTSAIVLSAPTAAQAAQPNQLCSTDSYPTAVLYTSPTSGIWVPAGSLIRILDYRGPAHYLARYSGTVGQFERQRVVQASCYFQ
jgi:hypothetical protein